MRYKEMKSYLKLFTALFCLFPYANNTVMGSEIVKVTGYPFPPFVSTDYKAGLTIDLIKLLNTSQGDYQFVFVPTSANRRYSTIKTAGADMIMFEMPEWDWDKSKIPYSTSKTLLVGGEFFIASSVRAKNQKFFKSIKDKHIIAMLGYHYAFANFNADAMELRNQFRFSLVSEPERIIQMIRQNKFDIGIITKSYLQQYIQKYPETSHQILISERPDQEYKLKMILKLNSPITMVTLETLVNNLITSKAINPILKKYNIEEQFVFRKRPVE